MFISGKIFTLDSDHKELFNELSDEHAGMLIKHILSYLSGENPESDNQLIKVLFIQIKQQIDRDFSELKKSDNNVKKEENSKELFPLPESSKPTKPKTKKFIRPTQEEIEDYGKECGHNLDGKKISEYYTDGDIWRDAKGTIVKNWKQKVRGVWCKDENKIVEKKTASNYTGETIYYVFFQGDQRHHMLTEKEIEKHLEDEIAILFSKEVLRDDCMIDLYSRGRRYLTDYEHQMRTKL